jgi:hypothetical protein
MDTSSADILIQKCSTTFRKVVDDSRESCKWEKNLVYCCIASAHFTGIPIWYTDPQSEDNPNEVASSNAKKLLQSNR